MEQFIGTHSDTLLGYGIPLKGFANDYSQMVVENKYMQEWISAAKLEKSTTPF
jgi:hypothetical protein